MTVFETVFPSSVGDPRLLPVLETHGVEILAAPKAPHWIGTFLGGLLPTVLLVGFFWWMGRRGMNQQQSIFGADKSQARRYGKEVKAAAPAILFVDELDAVGRRRGAGLGMVNDKR